MKIFVTLFFSRYSRLLPAGILAGLALAFAGVQARGQAAATATSTASPPPAAAAAAASSSPLEPVLARHGGLARWRGFGAVEYDMRWAAGARDLVDHQVFNLMDRTGLITAADSSYRIGFDGQEVWIAPNKAALSGGKMPARFYFSTPFYFFAIPFVLADPGVTATPTGRKTFEGRECDVVKVTFGPGVGDTPEDYYILYTDAGTHEVRLVAYVVTYPKLRGDKKMAELEPHALIYDEWQEAGDGLRVLRRGRFVDWNVQEAKVEGEVRGTIEFTNVKFGTSAPDAAKFAKPASGAEIDALR